MSVIFYGEELNLVKSLIIIILFVAIIMVKFDPNEKFVVKEKKWFIWVVLASFFLFLREGGLKITQELKLNNSQILLYSYAICFVLSAIMIYKNEIKSIQVLQKNTYETKPKLYLQIFGDTYKKNGIYFGLITGICSGLGLYLYSKALYVGPASLVALIFSARSMVIIALSYFLHKERLSLFQKCSVLFLCLGLSLASFI